MIEHISKAIVFTTTIVAIAVPTTFANDKGATFGFRHMSFPVPGSNTPVPPNGWPAHIPTNAPNNSNLQKNSVFVGCGDIWGTRCDAYRGDTSCSLKRHILCTKEAGNIKRPPYIVYPSGGGQAPEFYAGWSPKRIKLGPKVFGTQLSSLAVANSLCPAGWKMSSFHDGYFINGMGNASNNKFYGNTWNISSARHGGWSFHARFQGNLNKLKTPNLRFWVHSNGQEANCWN